MGKVCGKCSIEKSLDDFSKDKYKKDGLRTICKDCSKTYAVNYRNSEKGKRYIEIYNQSEKRKESRRKHNQSEKGKESKRKYRQSEKGKETRRREREKYRQSEKGKESKRRDNKNQREKYPERFRWRRLLVTTMKKMNTIKSASTHELLKYSADELKTHLDNLNMNWEVDHIDHKIPVSHFKKDTPPHIVNHLSNLQPLDPQTNISKGNSYADRVDEEYYRMARPYLL